MELLNGTPVFLWRAVGFFAVAGVVTGILLPRTPAAARDLGIVALLLSVWALLVQRHVRRVTDGKQPPAPLGA
ncbi:hypothetical protein [Pseudarthrobacter sp. S9]|uniref:hypothetical protein n=1 Tax=Pseudarthrobacter sp. S9 TaxID=3418421 RepID=UPI003D08550D